VTQRKKARKKNLTEATKAQRMQRRKGGTLRAIQRSFRENKPQVEKMIARSSVRPSAAVVFSVTRYYKTLKKLAKE